MTWTEFATKLSAKRFSIREAALLAAASVIAGFLVASRAESLDGNSLVAVMAIALTGLSMLLSQRERSAPFRGKLYDKQIEAYVELFAAFSEVCTSLSILRTNDQERLRVQEQLVKCYVNLMVWAPFLPSDVFDKMAAIVPPLRQNLTATSEDDWQCSYRRVVKSFFEIAASIRIALHTDPLSEETAALMSRMTHLAGDELFPGGV